MIDRLQTSPTEHLIDATALEGIANIVEKNSKAYALPAIVPIEVFEILENVSGLSLVLCFSPEAFV